MTRLTRLFRPRLRQVAAAASLGVALLATTSCGSTEPKNVPIESTVFADTLHITLTQFRKLSSGMYVKDDSTALGTGAGVTSGQKLNVRYAGYLPDGSLFDSNVSAPAPFTFTLGAGQVINGWEIGIQGMKVGGRRTLIIPPELGYGASGQGKIPPYAILVFTVSLISAT